MFPQKPSKIENSVHLEIDNLWPDGLIEPISFKINKGEILGLAGQLGSGAGEVLASIAGSIKSRSGRLIMNGKEFMPKNPQGAINNKIAFCSSDRKKDGLFLGRPIFENLTSPALEFISKFGFNFGNNENEFSKSLALNSRFCREKNSFHKYKYLNNCISIIFASINFCRFCKSICYA